MTMNVSQWTGQIILASLLLLGSLTTQAQANPQVKIQTNLGDIVLELYPDKAPKTVENFLNYVDTNFYSNTIFHRVIDGFMIQGGGFTQQFERKPTSPPVINEADNGLLNETGTIAMARTAEPHSATAQFFINVANNDFLNHTNKTPRGWGYTVFGKVIKGMEVVQQIKQLPTGPGGPFQRDVPKSPAIIIGISRVESDAVPNKPVSNKK
jgi:cyclophilin family peptidyl-prolyl cis-trans isomerase